MTAVHVSTPITRFLVSFFVINSNRCPDPGYLSLTHVIQAPLSFPNTICHAGSRD